jgi:light-regulated signal transduction histidine kinase (bacteriophytochrome)
VIRALTPAEVKIVADALRRAAAESRLSAAEALDGDEFPATMISRMRKQADTLNELAHSQDRLAVELSMDGAIVRVERPNGRVKSPRRA